MVKVNFSEQNDRIHYSSCTYIIYIIMYPYYDETLSTEKKNDH